MSRGNSSGDRQPAAHRTPGEDPLKITLQPLAVEREHGNESPADLHAGVGAPDRQAPDPERLRQRSRHDQAGDHQGQQKRADGEPFRV